MKTNKSAIFIRICIIFGFICSFFSSKIGISIAQDYTGSISGNILNMNHEPLEGAEICPVVFDQPDEGNWCEITDQNGYFRNRNLPNGDYALRINVDGYSQFFYPGTYDWSMAERITVVDGAENGNNQIVVPLPITNPPVFTLYPVGNHIDGYNWPLGKEINFAIDNPANPEPVHPALFSAVSTVESAPWDPSQTWVNFQLGDFELQPGYIIFMNDGVVLKELVVKSLFVETMWPDSDLVTGTAEQGTLVDTCLYSNGCNWRHVTTLPDGSWTADYSNPGENPDEQPAFDIKPGDGMDAGVSDEDGDRIVYTFSLYSPSFTLYPVGNHVDGYNWPLGKTVSLGIDDPSNPEPIHPALFSVESIVEPAPWDSSQTWVNFQLGNFEVQPGYIIYMSDGLITKDMEVKSLSVDAMLPDSDLVTGTAEPGSFVEVCMYNNGCNWRYITAFPDGSWTADYSCPGDNPDEQPVFDIKPGDAMDAGISDEDGDRIVYTFELTVINPVIAVRLDTKEVAGWDWPIGSPVTFFINSIFYGTADPVFEAIDPNHSHLSFMTGENGFQPGDILLLTNGDIQRTIRVAAISISEINTNLETIGGTLDSTLPITVVGCDSSICAKRTVFANENGQWTADFSIPGSLPGEDGLLNIDGGVFGRIRVWDGNFGFTNIDWKVVTDSDGDGVPDLWDNAPETPNPDQMDTDLDGIADVIDACPDDNSNSCNPNASASSSIDKSGEQLITADGSLSITIPENALLTPTSIGITQTGIDGGFIIANQVSYQPVLSFSITPHGAEFNSPVQIVFTWQDEDNDGLVDGTALNEKNLVVIHGNDVVTEVCGLDPGCDQIANTFTIYVSNLSLFVLGAQPNHPPVATLVSATINPVIVNSQVSATLWFTDHDPFDTHQVAWDWGDNSISAGIVNEVNGSSSGTHTYTKPGVFTVTAKVTDFAGDTSATSFNYLVVYDPDGGFVTGGGWAMSKPGDYNANPLISGKVNFGFDSKYHKFALLPSGNTRFDFKLGNIDFKSISYNWLLVDGAKAQIRGSGTINGSGDYGFIAALIDGKLLNGSNDDFFRIKIWNKVTGQIIFDNQPGDPDNANPTTKIGGGSITIHK